ncbi:hypothetical protein ACIQF6_24940 [Kitasatospora sp. NPDC092948]|uniref:hypothetical protein n=1 Tax=Kitasatospora sp. NPDC092948 TaxID=3364088 RepID=UPI003808B696
MSRRLVSTLAVAAFAVVGCTAADHPGPTAGPTAQATPAAAVDAAFGEPGPACKAEPSPTESWMGGWAGPLPEEIRCLPHVDHGTYSHHPPEANVQEGGENAVSVNVTPDTTRDQTLALCLRITELGYGLGGPDNITFLTVGNGEATGRYASLPGWAPCFMVR